MPRPQGLAGATFPYSEFNGFNAVPKAVTLPWLTAAFPFAVVPVAIYNAATGGSEGRKARRAARQERIRKRQAAKTARMEQRQAARLSRAEQRQEARAQRKAVRQQARLGKLAERKQLSEQLENLGAVAEGQKAATAIREATTNAKMRAYVENQGGEIEEGAEPEEIAEQAQELREEEIVDTQDALNENLEEGEEPYSYDEAENYLFDMYDAESFDGDDVNNYCPKTAAVVMAAAKSARATNKKRKGNKYRGSAITTKSSLSDIAHPAKMMDLNSNSFSDDFDSDYDLNDSDDFDPLTAAAIKAGGKKALKIIAEKRAKQGKKTLGMTPEQLEKALNPQYAQKDPTSDIGKVIEAGTGAYKTETAKQSADMIIVIVVVLIVIGVYIGFYKK